MISWKLKYMYYHTWYQHQSSLFSLNVFLPFSFLCQNRKYKPGSTYTTLTVSTYASSNTQCVLSFRVDLFVTCRPPDPDPLLFSEFNSYESPPHETLDVWFILSLGDVLHIPRNIIDGDYRVITLVKTW